MPVGLKVITRMTSKPVNTVAWKCCSEQIMG
ncbi:unnamed protein product, partial [Allacma fusca]